MTVHIRDVMAKNLEDVSQYAMCGDNGDKLTFGIPKASNCSRCKDRWNEEKRRESVKHGFRLKMHGLLNGGESVD